MRDLFPGGCPTLWRHKNLFIDPKVFLEKQIPVHQVSIRAGQLLIVHPRVLHWGWSVGFTVSASVNFCIDVFLPFLRTSLSCGCTTSESYNGYDFDQFLSHHEEMLHKLGCDSENNVYGKVTHDPEIRLEDENYYFVHSRQDQNISHFLIKAVAMTELFVENSKWQKWWSEAIPSDLPTS